MIVAIVLRGTEIGIAKLEEFRVAEDPDAAMTAFVEEYSTPRDPADYLAYDSGFLDRVVSPLDGFQWAWDFDNDLLVEMAIVRQDTLEIPVYISTELPPAEGHENELILVTRGSDKILRSSNGTDWQDVI